MTGWTCECGATALQGPRCPECGRRAWWLEPEAPVVMPRKGLDETGVLVAVVLVLVLLTGLYRVVQLTGSGPRDRRLRAAVEELSRYVERQMGGTYKESVDARLLEDAAFERAYLAGGSTDDDEPPVGTDFGATMRALGMAEPHEDPYNDPVSAAGVLGFYDTGRDVLYVRGSDVTPFVRLTLVHELTHAWQDQHSDLARLQESASTVDQALAILAVIEGDATRVESLWHDAQTDADRAAIARAEKDTPGFAVGTRGERTLAAMSQFPYAAGETFVTALAERGIRPYDDPPRSTEQVLEPEAYVGDDEPVHLPQPQADGSLLDGGTLGELGLVLVVARGAVDEPSLRAARGWGGDAYITYDAGDRTCTRIDVVMDSRADRDRLARVLGASEEGAVTKYGPRGLTLMRCAPELA